MKPKPGYWWRAQDSCVDNAKLILLNDKAHRNWFNLNCLASANGGVLPDIATIAIKLRMTKARAAAAVAELVAARLYDKLEDGMFVPHDWNEWQFKSDAKDPTGASRAQKYRDAHRYASRDASRVTTVTQKRPENRVQKDDDGDEASARPSAGNLVTPEAIQLTDKLLKAAGHDPAFYPPGWGTAAMRVQAWLNEGWLPEIIFAVVKSAAARKAGAPASSVTYFERAIAEEVAKQARPLPTVTVQPGETFNVQTTVGRGRESLSDVARRQAAAGITFGPRPTGMPADTGDAEGRPVVRLLSEG